MGPKVGFVRCLLFQVRKYHEQRAQLQLLQSLVPASVGFHVSKEQSGAKGNSACFQNKSKVVLQTAEGRAISEALFLAFPCWKLCRALILEAWHHLEQLLLSRSAEGYFLDSCLHMIFARRMKNV